MFTLLIALSALALAGLLVLCVFGLLARNGRLQKITENLKAEIQEWKLRDSEMRRITESALKLAHEKHFPKEPVAVAPDPDSVVRSRATYVPPQVKFCDLCNVSVRSQTWPIKCPNENCKGWIGDDEWPGVIE